MNPQNPDDVEMQAAASIEERIREFGQLMPATWTIFPFPDFHFDIDDGIRSPKLASFGPRRRDIRDQLLSQSYKFPFVDKFLSRTSSHGRDYPFYFQMLMNRREDIRRSYSYRIDLPLDDELAEMMLVDGSFMVELFREYDEHQDVQLPWTVQALIADLLKLENQLPFFVLKELFDSNNIGERPSTRTLPDLALRFLNQAFCNLSDLVTVNSQIQDPKHLLDLFHRSLLPPDDADPPQSSHHRLTHPIQSVKYLRKAGITVRQKTSKSLLDIDFRKFQIPPLALKIPPIAIDDFTKAILLNCVAWEQCSQNQPQHFTAYVCFMSCLLRQIEDVDYLRSVDIIKGFSQDDMSFIELLNGVGSNLISTLRKCYLRKQFREIHGYYNSYWAWIRRTFLGYNEIMLYCSLLQIAVGVISWRLSGK